MALWNSKDQVVFNTDISVTQGSATVTTAGDFTSAADNEIFPGDLLHISGVDYRVAQVASATSLTLTIPYAGTTGTVSAADAIRRPIPKYWLQEQDSVTQDIFFVDTTEATVEGNRTRGLDSPGWWLYESYTDTHGVTRYKNELLVALAETAANADDFSDDAVVADSNATITVSGQPTDQTAFVPLGAIRTVTRAGTAAAGTQTYTGVTGTASAAGTSAAFTVQRAGGVYTVTITAGGSGYVATETITVLGTALGGTSPTNDLVITVATIATAAATFSVTASASAGSLNYQWQSRAVGSTSWQNIGGATSASLALSSLTAASSGIKYRVRMNSTAGPPEVISSEATLTVTTVA